MSAEKKAQTRAEREEKRRQEERRERRSMAVYSVVAVVVVIAAAALMVWNAGILQRSLTAVEINGTKYSAADMQYYYNSIYSSYANQYFSASVSPKKQIRDQATGQTWYDYLVEQAVESLTDAAALSAQAKSEGYALSAEGQAQRDAAISQLDTAWLSYGQPSRDAFIRARFGPHMTYGRLVELMDMEFLASDYAASPAAPPVPTPAGPTTPTGCWIPPAGLATSRWRSTIPAPPTTTMWPSLRTGSGTRRTCTACATS